MQINAPPIEALMDNPIGTLLLETVKRSEAVTPRLQNAVASYVEFQSTPVMSIQPYSKSFTDKIFGKDKS